MESFTLGKPLSKLTPLSTIGKSKYATQTSFITKSPTVKYVIIPHCIERRHSG